MRKILSLIAGLFTLLSFALPSMAQEATGDDGGQTVDVITDGYYYVYTISGATERAMVVNNTSFGWDPLERGNAHFIFRLVSTGEENQFYMQNLQEGSWWGEITSYYESNFDQTEETRRAMTFAPVGNGTFKIRPLDWRSDKKDLAGHEAQDNWSPDGATGRNKSHQNSGPYVAYHSLSQWTGANWAVEKVSDSELQAARLNVKLNEALDVYNNAATYSQASEKLITNVDADADPASGEPSQFFTNCQRLDDKNSSFAHLIDGDLSDASRFQSSWASDIPKPQWIQVDVSADGSDKQIEGFQLELGLRASTWGSVEQPSEIAVFATNDETSAKDLDAVTMQDVSDNPEWIKIGEFQLPLDKAVYYEEVNNIIQWKPEKSLRMLPVEKDFDNRYITKNIILNGGKYRYIRFYILNTVVNQSENHDFTMSEMQMYELSNIVIPSSNRTEVNALLDLIKAGNTKVKNLTATADDVTALEAAIEAVTSKSSVALSNLQALIDSINSAGTGLTSGTAPGYNDPEKVAAYNAAYNAAVTGSHSSLPDAEYALLADELRSALAEAQKAIVQVTDGYYNIVNCYPNFFATVAITGLPTQDILGWQMYKTYNPAQVFKITKLTDGQYSVQNVVTGKYIGTIPGQSQEVKVTKEQVTPQVFTPIKGYQGQFNISNADNALAYHAEYHQSGANVKGYICTWNGGGNSCSAWRFVPVTGEHLDSLLASAPQDNLKAIAAHAIDTARAAYDKTFNYKQSAFLITKCDDTDPDNCQWWTTCQEPSANYTSYANLIDGNLGTVFQSTWQRTVHEKPQWMQADMMDHPVKDFTLYYGLRNGSWGAWAQWTQITVFATNEEDIAKDENIDTYEQILEESKWKKMGVFDLPDEMAIRNYSGTNRVFTYDINNVFDQKYRFIRFYATHCYKPCPTLDNDLGDYSIGELNIMENTYDETTAPYFYADGLKEAAGNLKAQEKAVAQAMDNNAVTQEQIDRLNELRRLVVSLTPNKDALQALYASDSTYVSRFAAGEQFGDVSEAEYSAVQTALNQAKAVLDKDQPTSAELNAQVSALGEALTTFKAAQKQFEPNKWYYIVSTDKTRKGSIQVDGEGETAGVAHTNSVYDTFVYGNCAYAPTDQTRAAYGDFSTLNINYIRWGYYAAGKEAGGSGGSALYPDLLDPHTMWRLVPIEGKDGQYAIQNRANGLFLTGYTGSSTLGLTNDSDAYVFDLVASGQYKFRAEKSSVFMQFSGAGGLYPYGNSSLPNSQWSFALEPVDTPEGIVIEYTKANTAYIKSLPYAVSAEVLAQNEGYAEIYGIKGLEVVDGDSTLLFEKKTSLEAGEPFVVFSGNYTAYDAESDEQSTLILPAAEDFSFEAKTVNGLTAVLDYTRLQKAGLGYFADAVLKSTTQGTGIFGHSGYIDINKMPVFTTQTAADRRYGLKGSGVNAIKGITTGKDGVVNVYSIDGKLIKKNVNSTKATKGLGKGIYIMGKEKVLVK